MDSRGVQRSLAGDMSARKNKPSERAGRGTPARTYLGDEVALLRSEGALHEGYPPPLVLIRQGLARLFRRRLLEPRGHAVRGHARPEHGGLVLHHGQVPGVAPDDDVRVVAPGQGGERGEEDEEDHGERAGARAAERHGVRGRARRSHLDH